MSKWVDLYVKDETCVREGANERERERMRAAMAMSRGRQDKVHESKTK